MLTPKQKAMCGHKRKARVHGHIMSIVESLKAEDDSTARELMQRMAELGMGSETLPKLANIDKKDRKDHRIFPTLNLEFSK